MRYKSGWMYIKYNLKLKEIARNLRNNPTDAERTMWNFLRVNFHEHTFFRQKPLDELIVDFYCPEMNIIIEMDGEIHDKQKERDFERDNIFLNKYSIKTIRFKNEQVYRESDLMKKIIKENMH